MQTVDKWFAICALIALTIVVGGMIATGAKPEQVGAAGGIGGLITLAYTVLRGIHRFARHTRKGNVMKRLLALTALVALAACQDVREETSDTLTEQGKVETLVYSPGFHKSDVNVGIDFDGNLTFTPTSVTVPDRYGVVFSCEHGHKFYIERRELYERLTQGQEVTIYYKEIYRCRYEDDVLQERVLVDYDFLDAK